MNKPPPFEQYLKERSQEELNWGAIFAGLFLTFVFMVFIAWFVCFFRALIFG